MLNGKRGKEQTAGLPSPFPKLQQTQCWLKSARQGQKFESHAAAQESSLCRKARDILLHSHAMVLREGVRMAQVSFLYTQSTQCHSLGTQPHCHPLYQGWARLFHCLLSIYQTLRPTYKHIFMPSTHNTWAGWRTHLINAMFCKDAGEQGDGKLPHVRRDRRKPHRDTPKCTARDIMLLWTRKK